MTRKTLIRGAFVALAVPSLLFTASGGAFADSNNVTWKDGATGRCLSWYAEGITGGSLGLDTEACDGSGRGYQQWRDIHNSDGSWYEKPASTNYLNTWVNLCLTAYYNHTAYIEPCKGNDYERWYEVNTSSGWHLKNKATGLLLDSNANGDVYALPANGGAYQLWH